MNPNPVQPTEAAEAPVISPEQRKTFLAEFDQDISSRLAEINRLHTPLAEGSAEQARLFITLSGGALIATISIVQLIAERIPTASAGWLLPASWILFGLTIVLSIFSLGAITRFRTLELEAVSARNRFLSDDGPSSPEELIHAVEQWAAHLTGTVSRITRAHNFCRVAGAVCFVLAFAAVIAFAIANSPF